MIAYKLLCFSLTILATAFVSGCREPTSMDGADPTAEASKTPVATMPPPTAIEKFTEAPSNKYVIYGDSRKNDDIHRRLVGFMASQAPRSVFHVGDMVEDSHKADDWKNFNDIIAPLKQKVNNNFFPVPGNHEKDLENYFKNFTIPGNSRWYSEIQDDLLFLMLDSSLFKLGADKSLKKQQLDWLESTLKAKQDSIKLSIIIQHDDIYGSTITEGNDADLIKIIEANKVAAVFSGGATNYERSEANGVEYVITGGGGAPLAPALLKLVKNVKYRKVFNMTYEYCLLENTDKLLRVTVHDSDDKPIDSFTLSKG